MGEARISAATLAKLIDDEVERTAPGTAGAVAPLAQLQPRPPQTHVPAQAPPLAPAPGQAPQIGLVQRPSAPAAMVPPQPPAGLPRPPLPHMRHGMSRQFAATPANPPANAYPGPNIYPAPRHPGMAPAPQRNPYNPYNPRAQQPQNAAPPWLPPAFRPARKPPNPGETL